MAAERHRGLGRGLSALLEETQGPAGAGGDAREVPIELIHRNPDQPRQSFDEAQLEDLARSIREKGVLQPILLRPRPGHPGDYQIVVGERRWRASQLAGLAAIPALVRELDDRTTLEIALIENLQRSDLNPMEEAEGLGRLATESGLKQEEIARAVGKSRPYVANMLRLLSLTKPVEALIRSGELSPSHGRLLVGVVDAETIARKFVDEKVSARDAEAYIRAFYRPEGGKSKGGRPRRGKTADTVALERDLAAHIGLTVQIDDRDGKGELKIAYQTLEQLDDLVRRLTRKG